MTVYRNKHRWDDKNVSEKTRLSTFDGATEDVEVKTLTSPQLIRTIEVLCKTISQHIWEVSGHTTQISIMTLYLQRADSESVCKLLFCTQLKARKLGVNKKPSSFRNKLTIHEPRFVACEEVHEDYKKNILQKIKIKSHKQGFFRAATSAQKQPKQEKKEVKPEEKQLIGVPVIKVLQKTNCSTCLGRMSSCRRNSEQLSNYYQRSDSMEKHGEL